jgi:hypothetical protein
MSTLERSAPPAPMRLARPAAAAPAPPPIARACIVWNVSLQALKGFEGPDAQLSWSLDLTRATATASLTQTGDPSTSLASASLTYICDGDLLHLEASDAGTPLLTATLRLHAEGAQLLYARTTLLAKLGLAGGRYEPQSRPAITR